MHHHEAQYKPEVKATEIDALVDRVHNAARTLADRSEYLRSRISSVLEPDRPRATGSPINAVERGPQTGLGVRLAGILATIEAETEAQNSTIDRLGI